MNNLWVIVDNGNVTKKIDSYIEQGDLASVNKLDYSMKALHEKMKSMLLLHGGNMVSAIYDKMVLNISAVAAEELPEILSYYKEAFNGDMAVGIGISMDEAYKANTRSKKTGNIELYGEYDGEISKAEFELPINMFDSKPAVDPKKPSEVGNEKKLIQPLKIVDLEHSMDAETKYISAIIKQLMGDQGQQQAQQQQDPNFNLLQALQQGQQQAPQQKEQAQLESQPEETKKEEIPEQANQDKLQQDKSKVDEIMRVNGKLGMLLETVKSSIPSLMELHDKNPQAFKQTMGVVSKIINMAKDQSKISKAELDSYDNYLNDILKIQK